MRTPPLTMTGLPSSLSITKECPPVRVAASFQLSAVDAWLDFMGSLRGSTYTGGPLWGTGHTGSFSRLHILSNFT